MATGQAEAIWAAEGASGLPGSGGFPGTGRLRQFVAYAQRVFGLRDRLRWVRDGRKDPQIEAELVAATVFFTGLLRLRSFNALEPRLSEKPFARLVGSKGGGRVCSVDTLSRALRVTDLETVRGVCTGIVAKAERNKVFREGWHWAMRYVALDGWEPIQSWHRHCSGCLVRRVKVKQRSGELVEVEQYYHRYVVAMLLDSRFDLVLDAEPLLPHDLRRDGGGKKGEDEGELTAAKRLLVRVKQTFGWVDVVVGDGLYANGPFLTVVQQLGMGAVVIARKESDEPLKEAQRIWGTQAAQQIVEDRAAGERVELWDCPGLETLSSYAGSIRVVRARVSELKARGERSRQWCMVVTGCATRLPPNRVLAVARGRWHLENTGFHQWTTQWHFGHVFTHDAQGILALYWLFFAAYNLLTLFLYRQLCCYGRDRGKNPTRTICRLIDEMLDDLARLEFAVWDTS